MPASVQLRPLPSPATGELPTLQHATHVTEAQAYGDPFLPALAQSLHELVAERVHLVTTLPGAQR
ncbi:hypothetical protein [Blastococcus atacamensis]|uniref:hypothetical protein n=1 Tax=Blastococcus atacamensis TaxID=2070508 RepID=UPI000CECD346|nr:hypothetical protein [Blastococcus atacamensis]